jgi:glutaminyl-peptide cyclotransferase
MRVASSAPWAFAIAVLVTPAATSASSGRPDEGHDARPPRLAWEVVSRRPHDPSAFTQGLVLDPSGRLYESTGLLGRSSLREVEPLGGEVLRLRALNDDVFGEGLALVDDRLIQLTWRNGIATAWDAATFAPIETFTYEGEGWGLCHDGARLVMSDGSDRLTFRDPLTFESLGGVDVMVAGRARDALNELECAEGAVWANLYMTDRIMRIDPANGAVTGVLDLEGIIDPHPQESRAGAVLNGIAFDPVADTYLVTGKLWPELIEIRILEPGSDPTPSPSATVAAPSAGA